MFTFYHHHTNTFTKWVEETLEEMVVAHKIINVEESGSDLLPNHISTSDLPLLTDGHEHWTSREEIKEFLEKLKQDLEFSRSVTSDACYVDPENPGECL
jgi:predicted nucleotidyltransferase